MVLAVAGAPAGRSGRDSESSVAVAPPVSAGSPSPEPWRRTLRRLRQFAEGSARANEYGVLVTITHDVELDRVRKVHQLRSSTASRRCSASVSWG